MIDEVHGDRAVRPTRQRDPHSFGGKRRPQPGDFGQLESVEKLREAGQHEAHIGPEFAQGGWQRRHDIAEAAGLDPGKQLGRGMQNAHRRGSP